MVFRIGWFSTGRDEAAVELLRIAADRIGRGEISAEISHVFCNRGRGEAAPSDRFIRFAEDLGLPVVLFSSRDFEPGLRRRDREAWRSAFHEEAARRVRPYPADVTVLAGYMLIVSPAFCRAFPILNLHPAEPGGPKGTWQEVIWQLLGGRAGRTGVMIHLVTEVLDEGPPVTFVTFPIRGPGFDPLWRDLEEKLKGTPLAELIRAEGERNPLFAEIRRQGVRRELPLIVMTLKALAEGQVAIRRAADGPWTVEKKVDGQERGFSALCLNEAVESLIAKG
jgi:phosphoribosylglycinamide formyltransferase-1